MFKAHWMGLTSFEEAYSQQILLHEKVLFGAEGFVLGLEHPTVITLGVRGKANVDLLECAGIPVLPTDRGGQATLHSPGQLVIYPILPWKKWGLSPKDCVQELLQTTVDLFNHHGISAFLSKEGTGVYTAHGKIAFCGLRIQQGVSRHGLSLNLSNDLGLFRKIRACGSSSESLTSWSREIDEVPALESVFSEWVSILEKRLQRRFSATADLNT